MRTNCSKSLGLTFDPPCRRSSLSQLARNVLLSPFLGAVIACFAMVSVQALPIITSVVETGGDNEPTDTIVAQATGMTFTNGVAGEPLAGRAATDPYTVGLFGEKAPMFVDRNHQWAGATNTVPLPSYLVGGEYIMSGNDNRDNTNYVLKITVSKPAIIYMLIDSRLEDGTSDDPPSAGKPISAWTNMTWMATNGFAPVVTGANRKGDKSAPDEVGADEGGDGTVNQTSAVYSKTVAAGSVTTIYQADNAGRNMYGVVVTLAPDITPPTLVSASTLGDPTSITVRFSEPVSHLNALNLGNYFINNGGTIISTTHGADGSSVILKVAPLNLSLSYSLFVKDVTDVAAKPNTLAPNPSLAVVDTFQGRLLVEVFTNLTGTAVSDLTGAASFIANKPGTTATITSFQYTPTGADNYGARASGYVTAPETGKYVFFLSADDNAALYLSTDENPANKRLIARETVWSNARQWTASGGSSSLDSKRSDKFAASEWPGGGASLALTAGKRYYIEALVKEGTGGDQLSVGWRLPSATADPANDSPAIGGAFLSIPVGPATILQQPAATTIGEQAAGTLSIVVSGAPPYSYQWSSNGVAIVGATGSSLPITSATLAQSGAVYSVKISNGFSSVTSDNAALTVTADTTAPTAVSAVGSGTLNTVALVFSETITRATATNSANYAVSGGVTVSSASLGGDAKSVLLTTSAQTPGTVYTVTVNGVKDTSVAGNTIAANSTVSFTGWVLSPGFILREVYTNIGSGIDVTNLTTNVKYPNSPDVSQYVSPFEAPGAYADNYGQRLSGYLLPPVTGNYVFYICSDDRSALLLSTDENPANKVQIAREPEWNDSRQWLATTRRNATNPENKSVSIPLTAGKRYYVEALLKEGGGGDNLAVAWMLPNQTNAPANGSAPIGYQFIATYANPEGAAIKISAQPESVTVAEAPTSPTATFKVTVLAQNASSTNLPVVYQWQKNGVDIVGANSASYTTPGLVPADSGAKFRVIIAAPAATATSQDAVVTVTRDTTAPSLVSANTFTRPNKATVVFSEAVSDKTATDVANYTITGTTVNSAVKTAPNVVELTYGIAPAAPAPTVLTTNETLLVGINNTNQLWRYENTGADLGTAWKEKAFNDSAWPQGPALLALETGATAEPIRTTLKRTKAGSTANDIITDYFRTHFNFTGDPTKATLQLRHVVDDGVAIYLNGVDIHRFYLTNAGPITAATLATPSDHENKYEGPFNIPASALVAGDNVLAAEVHQNSATSSDMVFGLELKAITVTSVAVIPPPVVSNSTIFEFNFDEGSGSTATSKDGKLVGTLTTTNTPATLATFSTDSPSGLNGDYSMQFATGQKITVPDPGQVLKLDTANPSFTVEAWLKFTTPSARAVFFFNQAGGGRVSASVFTNRTGFVTTLGILDVPSKAAIPDDSNWHHYAVVHENGKELRFYVDGTLGDTVPYTRSVSFNATNQVFYIGSEPTGGLQYVGKIDRLRYSMTALAPAELDSVAVTKDAPIAYEGFDYPAGNLLSLQGGLGWANAWQTNGSAAGTSSAIVAGGLGYSDASGNTLLTSGNKAHVKGESAANNAAQPNRDLQTGVRGADNTTTWLSFLGQRMGPATTNLTGNFYPRGCNISLYSNTVEQLAIGNGSGAPLNNWALLPAGSAANVQASSTAFSKLSLIVVRIDHKAGMDDAYLFVNPPLGVEPSIASAAAKSTNTFNFAFNRIRPFAGGNDTANSRPYAELDFDEIRVGNTFSSVTPYSGGKGGPLFSGSKGGPVIKSGLVAYWNFEGNLLDAIQSFHGTARGTNPVEFVQGRAGFGNALKLNGTNYVEITDSATSLQFASGSLSIGGWFKVDSFDKGWQSLISKGENLNYRIARRGTTSTIAYAGGVGEGADDVPAITNGWHHFMAVTDATGVKFGTALYVDGVLSGVNTNKAVLAAGVSNLFIGENPGALNRQWTGQIDDIGLWNRVLSAAEVSALYAGGTGKPVGDFLPTPTLATGLAAYWSFDGNLADSVQSLHGTARGPVPVGFVDGQAGFGKAIQLNGTNYVEIMGSATPLQFAGSSLSIAGWFKVEAFDKGWQALISKGENLNYRIARRGTTSTVAYAGGVGEGADDVPAITNGWHHFVAVTDPSTAKFGTALYVDGVLRSVNTNKAVLAAGVSNLFIGENPGALNRQWRGQIDDIALWNRVLTDAEVSMLYAGGTSKPLSALLSPRPARTYSIGLNFGADEPNGAGTGTIAATDVAGLPGIAQANWNNLRGASGVAGSVSADNSNKAEATGVIVQWNSANTWSSTGRGEENSKFATNSTRAVMTGYLDTPSSGTTTVSILGVPTALTSSGYDVYVYALGGVGGRGGAYRVVDATTGAVLKNYVRGQSPANPTAFVEIPASTSSTSYAAGTYLVFKGLNSANITIEATTAGGLGFSGTPRAPINAIQLVAPPIVPVISVSGLTVNGVQDTADQANTIAASTKLIIGTVPAYPADFGTIVNGFQDDFNAPTLNLNWKVRGPGTNVFRLNNGFLSVTNGFGDPNHLLYEAAGYDKTNQEVLVRVRINSFGSGDPVRAGVGVAVSGDAANQGINYHFRNEGANAVHTEFLDDARSWGPELPFKWQSSVWYWVRLKYAPNTATGQPDVFAKIWQADGTVPEPSDWQSTWDRHPAEARIRSGFAGITGGSADGLSVFDVDYILIKAAGLNSTVANGGQTALLIAGTDAIETTEGVAVGVPSDKLLANDVGGGGILRVAGVLGVSAQGGTVSLATNVVTYVPKAGFRGSDSFIYVLASNAGAATTGIVNVTVNAGNNQSQNVVSVIKGDLGVVVTQFLGIPGRRYTVQASLDLKTWTDVGTATASPKGVVNFIDLDGGKFPQRFYRTAP